MASVSEAFSYEDITSFDPGWSLTGIVVLICVVLNLFVPLLVRTSVADNKLTQNVGDGDGQPTQLSRPSVVEQEREGTRNIRPYTRSSISSVMTDARSMSVVSAASSSYVSQIASSVLNARPAGRRGRRRRRTTVSALARGNEVGIHEVHMSNGNEDAVSVLNGGDDDEQKSVLSRLDQDAISVNDAVDAQDGTASPEDPTFNKMSPLQRLLGIVDWDLEMKKIFALGVPFMIAELYEGVFGTVDVALVGHFIGIREANAFIMVQLLVEFTETLSYGFTEAIGTLVPQAKGTGNKLLVGRYVQIAMVLNTISLIPGTVMWLGWTENAILWFGFDEATARLGQQLAYPYVAKSLLDGITGAVENLLETIGHERYSALIGFIDELFFMLLLIILPLAGVDDLIIVGTVQTFVSFLIDLGYVTYVVWKGWLDDYWEGLAGSFSLRDRRAVKNMLITGIPLGFSWLLTYGEWEVMTLFASFIGPAEVAVWGILGYLWDAFEMLIEGLSSAGEIRVGNRLGAKQPHLAKLAAYKSVYLGLVISIFETALLFITAPYLPSWLTPDPVLQSIIFDTLPLLGFGQILMAVGQTCWNILSAQGRVGLATTVEFIVSWLLVLPTAAVLVVGFDFNLMGLVAALVIGYSIGGVIVEVLLFRSDWDALSQLVIQRNCPTGEDTEDDWDDRDWLELPDRVQDAAALLGYNKKIWDNNTEPEGRDRSWASLSRAEINAATILGFSRKEWNNGRSKSKKPTSTKDDYDDTDWSDLPPHVQAAAKVLGYNKKIWDKDGSPASTEKEWEELTELEREAALTLGYDELKWDEDDSDSSSSSSSSDDEEEKVEKISAAQVDESEWDDLPIPIRKAACVLGYNKQIWDADGAPASDGKSWYELSAEEQNAANVLGYTQEKWDDGSSTSSVEGN